MKSFTDLKQSKMLAEFLPIESVDLYYDKHNDIKMPTLGYFGNKKFFKECPENSPCWSLSALINLIPSVEIILIDNGTWACGSMGDRVYAGNPIDACYEMLIKLHEQNLL